MGELTLEQRQAATAENLGAGPASCISQLRKNLYDGYGDADGLIGSIKTRMRDGGLDPDNATDRENVRIEHDWDELKKIHAAAAAARASAPGAPTASQ